MNKKIRWRVIRSLAQADAVETPPDTPVLSKNLETGEKKIDYFGDFRLYAPPTSPSRDHLIRIVQKISVTPLGFGEPEKLTVPYGIQIGKVVQLLYPEIEGKKYVIRRASTRRPLKPHSKVKRKHFGIKPEEGYFDYTVERAHAIP